MRKKAALELSINAIVIVILAMTLLGLGLGFVKKIMDNAIDLSDGSFSKMKDKLQQDLMETGERLVFSQSEIKLEKGKASLQGFGLKNVLDAPLQYGIKFNIDPDQCPDTWKASNVCKSVEDWFTYKKSAGAYKVATGETDQNRIDLRIPTSAVKGLYLIEVEAYTGGGLAGCEYKSLCTPSSSYTWTNPSSCSTTDTNPVPTSWKNLCDATTTCTWNDASSKCIVNSESYSTTEIFLTVN
jgi:hypothetical protein